MGRIWLLWGCLLAMTSVILGAFGAHSFKNFLEPDQMQILTTANYYMGYHAMALLALGLWNHWEKWSATLFTGLCFLIGVVLFSGSLYVIVFLEFRKAGMITPIGGTLFIIGWVLFAISVIKTKNTIV